jgi:thiosulfate dehydrogenase [quinone] large subunit
MSSSTLERTQPGTADDVRRLHTAAVVRIAFGVIWAIDATFKFMPGFVHGQTLEDELGGAKDINTPIVHQWIELWHNIGTAHPEVFAISVGIIESLIALGLIFGAFTNLVFVGSAIFSFGIWSAAEGFHLPWNRDGITDLGPSVGYIIASLALLLAAAGTTWSIDQAWNLRERLGKYGWLSAKL